MLDNVQTLTRLTLVRHGETTFNAAGIYQGSSDRSVLTSLGRKQAEHAAEKIAHRYFDYAYVSPLTRARETFDIIKSGAPGVPDAVVFPLLQEISLPGWEGRTVQDVRESEKNAYRQWKFFPARLALKTPEGVTFNPADDVLERAHVFLDYVTTNLQGRSVLAVSHGGFIRGLLTAALGMIPDRLHSIAQENCGFTTLVFDQGRLVSVETLNATSMPDEQRFGKRVAANAPLVVLAGPKTAKRLAARYQLASSLLRIGADVTEQPPVDAPYVRIVEAHLKGQKRLFSSVLGLSDGMADVLIAAEERFHLFSPVSPSGPATLQLANGQLEQATECEFNLEEDDARAYR